MFHGFVEILREYIDLPPPKMALSDYIKEKIRSPENENNHKQMTFNINLKRDGISFYGFIHIRKKGKFAGLISSIELNANGIALTMFKSPTNFINLGEIPFTDIIAFHEVKLNELPNFMPTPKITIINNRQNRGITNVPRHIINQAGSIPNIQL